jgi:hypothetical protein
LDDRARQVADRPSLCWKTAKTEQKPASWRSSIADGLADFYSKLAMADWRQLRVRYQPYQEQHDVQDVDTNTRIYSFRFRPGTRSQSGQARQSAISGASKSEETGGQRQPCSFQFLCAGVARAKRQAPDLEPVKLFDNLYAIGSSESPVQHITTSGESSLSIRGLLKTESVIIPSLSSAWIPECEVHLLAHAQPTILWIEIFQDHYGTKVALSAPDWDFIEMQSANANAPKPPARSRANWSARQASDQPIMLSNSRAHAGSMHSFLSERQRNAAHCRVVRWHDAFVFPASEDIGIQGTSDSIDHYLEFAKRMNVDVEIQNHPLFDDTPARLTKLKTLKAGERHPFP